MMRRSFSTLNFLVVVAVCLCLRRRRRRLVRLACIRNPSPQAMCSMPTAFLSNVSGVRRISPHETRLTLLLGIQIDYFLGLSPKRQDQIISQHMLILILSTTRTYCGHLNMRKISSWMSFDGKASENLSNDES